LAVVGRSPRCALRVDRARASRTHAILLRTATGLLVVDLASRYGTRIDGEDVKMLSSVRPEAVLEFADASYHCRIESASLAVAAPPARVVARPLPADALALLESNTSPDPSRLVSILLAAVQASHQELLRRQDEQARALHAQLETLRRGLENLAHGQSDQSQRVRNDLAELRDEIRRRFAPGGLPRPRPGATPAVRLPPLNTRLTAPDSSTDPAHATSWLLQRLMQINRERAPDEPD
jgi:hypothetical protein